MPVNLIRTNGAVLYHAGPDFATGFGLVDAEGARDLIARSSRWKQATLNSAGASHTWCFNVPQGSDQVKVAVAWDDEPGDTTAAETAVKLVNDLDLELIAPDGTTYRPWTLDPLPLTANPGDGAQDPIGPGDVHPAYRGVDHRNNVEMASVPLPPAGMWRARVTAFALPNGNAQPYTLVSSHNLRNWCPIGPIKWCKLHPRLCPRGIVPICVKYPWICETEVVFPPIEGVGGKFTIDPHQTVPIDEICKYVLNCPGCGGGGAGYCPGWRLEINSLPPEAVVTVFNHAGQIIAEDKTPGASRMIALKQVQAGDRFFFVLTTPTGKPYGKPLALGVTIGRFEREPR